MEYKKDFAIRQALINNIKSSGIKAIEERKLWLHECMIDLDLHTNKNDYFYFDEIIREITALNYLKEYLYDKYSMLDIEWETETKIDYIIPLETLEIWYNEGVVNRYLSHIDIHHLDPYYLTDNFFGYKSNFISIIDKVVYDYKQKERNEK